jgi:isochorismate synthase
MSELLLYQFPGSAKLVCLQGTWKKSSMNAIPSGCFFVTDFKKEQVYYFEQSEEVSINRVADEFHYSTDDYTAINQQQYLKACTAFKADFERNKVRKAIFSRIKEVKRNQESPIELVQRLANKYREQAFVYLISSAEFGTWLGATPEVLVSGDAQQLSSMSLAGTKVELTQAWTEKEIEEQQLVTDFMREQINELAPLFFNESPVETIHSGAVYHLCTQFQFSLPQVQWNELLKKLHPTPAVCGLPRENAHRLIEQHEPHNRRFYTGLIGVKSEDSVNIFVNLRCMEVKVDSFLIYVGGGITALSNPENEWEETENKAKTLMGVLS